MSLGATPTATVNQLRMKVCLAGESGVGKTSLIRRFVHDDFSDRYISTMGAKVSSRSFEVPIGNPARTYRVDMTVWDIMGAKGFRELLKEAYFFQAQGILAVCDITHMETLQELLGWHETVRAVSGWVPMVVLANKSDLPDRRITEGDLDSFCGPRGWSHMRTSAKTGQGVEEAFRTIAKLYLGAVAH